jgi:hypothetical protein
MNHRKMVLSVYLKLLPCRSLSYYIKFKAIETWWAQLFLKVINIKNLLADVMISLSELFVSSEDWFIPLKNLILILRHQSEILKWSAKSHVSNRYLLTCGKIMNNSITRAYSNMTNERCHIRNARQYSPYNTKRI